MSSFSDRIPPNLEKNIVKQSSQGRELDHQIKMRAALLGEEIFEGSSLHLRLPLSPFFYGVKNWEMAGNGSLFEIGWFYIQFHLMLNEAFALSEFHCLIS